MTHYQRKKILIIISSCIIYYTLAGFIILPFLIKTFMVTKLPDFLGRDIIVNKVKINPYILTLALEGLIVKDKNGEILISSDEVFINIQSSSIFKRALVIKELHLKGPYFGMIRNADNTYNFSDLIKKSEEPQKEEKDESGPPRFFLDGIKVEDGNFYFHDKKINKSFAISDIELSVPFISSLPEYTDIDVLPYFSAYINGDPIEFKAKTRPFNQTRQSYLKIDIDKLSLPDFFAYLPLSSTVDLRSGNVDIDLAVSYSEEVKGTPTVSVDGNVTLSHFEAFDKKNAPLIKLPTLSIDIAPSTPLTKKIYLDMISIRSPEVYVQKNNTGQLNLLNVISSDSKTHDKQPRNTSESKTEDSDTFTFVVKQGELIDGKVIYSDQSLRIPFTSSIQPLNISLSHLTNQKNQEAAFTVSAKTDGDEKLDLSGNLSLNPLAVKGTITARDFPINRYKPFYNDFILFDITDGTASLKSEFRYDSNLQAPGVIIPDLTFSLNSLILTSQKDKEEFLHIPALSLNNCSFDSSKQEIQIGQFSTEKASFFVKRDEKGLINVLNLVPAPSKKESKKQKIPKKQTSENQSAKKKDKQNSDASGLWHVKVNETLINEYKLKIEDRQGPELARFTVDNISMGANDFTFKTSAPAPLIKVADLSLSLKTLTLHSQKNSEDIMNIGSLSLNKCSFNSQKQAMTIGEFATEKGSFFIRRSKEGIFNFQNIAASSQKQNTKEEKQKPARKKSNKKKDKKKNSETPQPWNIKVNKVSFKDYSLKTEDLQSPEKPLAAIDTINLDASEFTFKSDQKEPLISLPSLSLSLKKLNIHSQKSNEDIISIGNISFNECSYDSQKHTLRVKDFASENGSFVLRKSQDGVFNIQNLAGPSAVGQKVSDELSPLIDEEKKMLPVQDKSVSKEIKAQKPFQVLVDQTSLKGYTIKAEDLQSPASTLLTVKDISLNSDKFTFKSDQKEPLISLPSLSLSLEELKLRSQKNNEDFIRIPQLSFNDCSFNSTKKEVKVGHVKTEKGFLLVRKTPEGKLNFQSLSSPASDDVPPVKAKVQKAEKEQSWRVKVKKASLKGYTVKAEDLERQNGAYFTFDRINFEAQDFSTDKNNKTHTSLSFRLNEKGNVNLKGITVLDPLALNFQVNISDLPIPSFKPYYTNSIKLIVKKGFFNTGGNFSFFLDRESKPKISYSGNISITDFASVDPIKSQDFLKWNSLSVNDIVFGYAPVSLIVEDIALNDFYSLIVINSDKTMNFKNIVVKEEKQEDKQKREPIKDEQEKEPAPDVFIKKISLDGGNISFADKSIKPSFTSDVIELHGSITGLSSRNTTAAQVNVTGQLQDHAPLEITGTINPFAEELNAHIRMSFKGIGLSPFTPYSGKYLGYSVQKGKLTLNLDYKIINGKLNSKNRLLFDQLTLGDKVDSPQAVKAPIRLALALLTDRNGVIDLDLPVDGDFKDPEFSLGSVILHVFKNLITKAVTSPYSFIKGAMGMGSGEKLNFIEFDYGSTTLNKEAIKKLDIIANALYNRPSLKLEIAGSVDEEKDFQGLREKNFEELLKTEKAKYMVEKGQKVPPFDEMTIKPDEYETFLTKAYKEADFPKEKTALGLLKKLPPDQMEKLLNDHIEVTKSDVKLLAQKRATVVKEYILKTGKVKSKRIFIVLSASSTEEIDKKVKKSRVLFSLTP